MVYPIFLSEKPGIRPLAQRYQYILFYHVYGGQSNDTPFTTHRIIGRIDTKNC